jgi:DNA-binding NarL/FixJ family response regulator
MITGKTMLNKLSRRQQEIALLVITGASNKQIARELAISEKTVKNTLTTIFSKTNTCCRTQLAVQLVRAESQPNATVSAMFSVP